MSDIVKTSTPRSDWRWSEGKVNEGSEHFKLFQRDRPQAVALVGLPVGTDIPVMFTDAGMAARQSIERELDFYILELAEPDPWKYLKYHCGTASNLYGEFRWAFASPT